MIFIPNYGLRVDFGLLIRQSGARGCAGIILHFFHTFHSLHSV